MKNTNRYYAIMELAAGAGYVIVLAPTLKRLDKGLATNPEVMLCVRGIVIDEKEGKMIASVEQGKRIAPSAKKGEGISDFFIRLASNVKAWKAFLAEASEAMSNGANRVVYAA